MKITQLSLDLFNESAVDPLELELAIEDALFRIRREYERTNGQIYLSFSGGKDSTVLAHLIKMAELPTAIPFVFANTGIELDATLRFVKEFDYPNVVVVKPKKPFAQILKDHGKPALSKLKSDMLYTYQNHIDNPFETARSRQLITGQREKNGQVVDGQASQKLANKHMHFLHPDTEFKVANKCCHYLKKEPFKYFEEENNMMGSFNGVRVAEGGTRALMYKSCVQVKQKKGKEFYFSMPIIDWSDEVIEAFIQKYGIKLSDAYEVYGMNRTGCMGCPFGKNIQGELRVLYDYEPNKYKAILHWLKDVYMYQMVECPWDEEYMAEYKERLKVIEARRQEMMDQFRPRK